MNEQPGQVPDVIVTAQKRREKVQEVPIAVTVITREALELANITAATDIKRLAPSLQYSENTSVRGTSFQIRGVGTQSFSNGLEQSVGTVVDGVAMTRNGMGNGDLLDLDHVEVLRGPQGMLFGKNASAGVVSIISRRPTDQFSTEGRVTFGTYDEVRASAVVNVPLATSAAFRLAGFSNRRDGLVTNVFDGRRLNDHQEVGLKARLLWASDDERLQAYMMGDLSKIDGSCCLPTVRSVVPGSALAGSLAVAGIVPGPRNFEVNLDAGGYSRSTNGGVSMELTARLGEHELTSLTAWRTWKLRENSDSDGIPGQALSINYGRSDLDQLTQEFRFASPVGRRFEYLLGVYYFNSRLRGNNGQQGSLSLTSDTPVTSRFFIATNRNESLAAFGQATVRLAPNFRLIAGARFTHDNVSMDFERSFVPGTLPASPPLSLHPSTSASNLSGRLGVQYDFDPDVMAYLTVSRGYKGPGFNALQGATIAANKPVRPEIPTSFEIGLKSSLFDRRLTLNLAVFDTRFKDFQGQFNDPTIPPLGAFVVGNAGELHTSGAELEFAAYPATGLSLTGGVSYTDARFSDFKRAACWGTPERQRSCTAGVFDASGTQLPNAPKWTVSLQALYERHLGEQLSGFASLDGYWRSSVNDSLGDPNMVRGDYGLIGATIGLSDIDGRWRLSAWARNLLDSHYTGTIIVTPLSAGSYSQFPVEDARRTVGVSLAYAIGS